MKRAVVVGGGLAGLTCALELAGRDVDVVVLEAAAAPGGVVGTTGLEGFYFERGPTTVQASARAFRELCGRLGLADRLVASSPAARHRFLFHRGRLRELPRSPLSLMTSGLLSMRGKLAVLSEPLRRRPSLAGEIEPDLATFLSERIGHEAARRLGGAFVRGVYAAELEELGVASAFPRLWSLVRQHGGIARGLFFGRGRGPRDAAPAPGPATRRGDLIGFREGMQVVVDALARTLGPRLRTRSAARGLSAGTGGWAVALEGGEVVEASDVVLAVPAHAAGRLLLGCAPEEVPVHALLRVDHAALAVVHLGLDRDALPELPSGFGFLVPPDEEPAPKAFGVVFASEIFPGRAPEGALALTAFYPSTAVQDLDDGAALRLAAEELAFALGRRTPPEVRVGRVDRWEGVIPRYGVGHAERMADLRAAVAEHLPGLHLAGCYLDGVSVDQVVRSGLSAADSVLRARTEVTA